MVFGVSFIVPIESVGAYTSHSRDEAVAWARSQIGSKIDVDGAYGAQCVDLIKAYYQYLGVSSVLGNGCDYSHNSLPSGWTRIQNTPTFVPEPGDIVVWTDEGWKNGHVAIFLSGDTHSFTSIDQNWPQGSAVKEVSHNYNYVWGVIRPDFNGGNPVNPDPPNPPNPSSDHNPTAVSDAIVGGDGCIGVCGWAFDKDDTSQAIYVHVYIGGNSGDPNAEGHVILANKGRPDVGAAYGCGDFHGYDETITTAKRGNQPVYVYAINIGEGNDNPLFGSGEVNITQSTPMVTDAITDAKIWDISKDGFRVTCHIRDGVAFDKVLFPTWTLNNDQDDLVWHEGTISGNSATVYISVSEHNNERDEYATHIYLYNSSVLVSDYNKLDVISINDKIKNVVTDATIWDISKDGFRVTCHIRDGIAFDKVLFPTWTLNNDQDDLVWHEGTISGNSATVYISVSEHNNEHDFYATHIYVYNSSDCVSDYGKLDVISINDKIKPVDIGTDFYANIIRTDGGTYVTNNNGNVEGKSANSSTSQMWYFERHDDWYYIKNCADERYLDDADSGDENGTNVRTVSFTNSDAQRWYVCGKQGAYYLRPKCSSTKTMDLPSNTESTNIHLWAIADISAQKFTISKLKDVESVDVNKHSMTLGVGQAYTLRPTTTPADVPTTFKWKTSNKNIATVTSLGKVTGRAVGKATITVTTENGKTATCTVVVKNAPDSITLNKSEITLGVGQMYTLQSTLTPTNTATYQQWTSSDKTIAVVNDKGRVTGKKVGTATITVKTTNGHTAVCKVTVKKAPTGVAVNKTSINVGIGQKYTLKATLTPTNSATYCTWTSSDTSVATVTSSGVVTGKKVGTATIMVKTTNGKTAECTVKVKKAPDSITLDKTSLSLKVGETYTLTKTLSPVNSVASYTWLSSDTAVATVSSTGKVTAKKTGTATIVVTTHNGKTAICTVTVK